jgi:hypothetical protein
MAQACDQPTTHEAPSEKEVITCAKRQTMAFHPSVHHTLKKCPNNLDDKKRPPRRRNIG